MSFLEASGLKASCREAYEKLELSLNDPRQLETVSNQDLRIIGRSFARQLLAVNLHSRITFAKALCQVLDRKFSINDYCDHHEPIFFITLIPKHGLISARSQSFDVGVVKNGVKANLRRHNYLGIIEPGFYASLPRDTLPSSTQAISWHFHLLLWGLSVHHVGALVAKLERVSTYKAVSRELKSVHVAQINNGELPNVVGYMLKPPGKAMRVQRYPWIHDGKPVRYADGSQKFFVKHLASKLQNSERRQIFHAMKHITLDELLVSGGDGKELRRKVLAALAGKTSAASG